MGRGQFTYQQALKAPRMPSVFFDGTRLGLEGAMLATLSISIPCGLHIGLSTTLGYAMRYSEGLPAEAKPFSLFGFLLISALAAVFLSMVLFFFGAIPTMAYNMGLVALMLRLMKKVHRKEKLTAALIGSAFGLLTGLGESAIVLLLMGLHPTMSLYTTLLRWPAILSIDGISLLWFTLNPIANAVAGAQSGRRLGEQIAELTLYWFW